ncbi:hypothetical protein HQQ94_09550 [Shewanella sp. VB17]|uniref:hypothetical protein n=1 Tax=Shewanella sp. VB17 TaxID=2739432 RepID=UPI001564AC48|nr:hypothetical protein [Shewanella sp. VB17]NRD73485.1 hypothetical protein [Shewanella sp. VB17]
MSPILAAHLRLASNVRASIGHHGPTVITHFIRGNGRHPRPNAIAPVIATIGDIGSGNEIRLRKRQNGFGPDGAISVINMKIKKIRLPTLGGITVGCFKRDFAKIFRRHGYHSYSHFTGWM